MPEACRIFPRLIFLVNFISGSVDSIYITFRESQCCIMVIEITNVNCFFDTMWTSIGIGVGCLGGLRIFTIYIYSTLIVIVAKLQYHVLYCWRPAYNRIKCRVILIKICCQCVFLELQLYHFYFPLWYVILFKFSIVILRKHVGCLAKQKIIQKKNY